MSNQGEYLLRSLMFVPSHKRKYMDSASRSDADVLLLDVEDSVQSSEEKQVARDLIVECVEQGIFERFLVIPRINDRESGQLLKDITQLTISGVHGFMYPKSFTGQDIYFIDKLLDTIEYEKGFPIGTFKLIPLIETSSAVLNADEICKASKRVLAIAFGCEDFLCDLGGIHDVDGQSIFVARYMISLAARTNNVIPIDTVHVRVHDLEDLERNLVVAKNLGFEGMLVLNPKEIPLVHRYFSPTDDEVRDAVEMLRLSAQTKKEGRGVAVINNTFVGPPMVLAAQKICNKHKMIKNKSK